MENKPALKSTQTEAKPYLYLEAMWEILFGAKQNYQTIAKSFEKGIK